MPLLVRSLGAPLGVPVADDWDFVHRALLTSNRSLLDGGGSTAFWRPIPHQLYYLACSSLMLSHPLAIAALHTVVLGLMGWLGYRAARTRLPAPWAATVASFPLIAESTRAIVAWPCHMVELSFLFFSVLALHEAVHRRMPLALAALLAALLSKEVAVVTALFLPWVPRVETRRERLRWVACVAAATLAWVLAYLAVREAHHLHLPHDLESAPDTVGTPWLARYAWALVNSARAALSLTVAPVRWEPWLWGSIAAIAAAAVWTFVRDSAARERLRTYAAPIAFGALWFAAAAAPLTVIYPFWMPHRSLFGGMGLALALACSLGAARPALLATLVALRLGTLALAPGAPATISELPPERGAFLDFERLARIQRVMVETRRALEERHPSLPHGARVGLMHPAILTDYAFGRSLALQCWYRDTTLRWLRFEEFRRSTVPLDALVLYQPGRTPRMMLVEPAAMERYLSSDRALRAGDLARALADLHAADSLQRDTAARVFLSRVAGRRAICWLAMDRSADAEREGLRSLALWRECSDGRYAVASVMSFSKRLPEARAHLDTLLRQYPGDRSAQVLRDSLERWSRAGS
ncbi:MAG TPA: hypothetical protein VJY35_04500 [Candidatus Eisenbacteria bacterium]|nr:hypothetical protein [Candidatus Eisenbacteria bacterium]